MPGILCIQLSVGGLSLLTYQAGYKHNWMELETAKHIRGERISEYLQTLHRVRRLQNRNILDNFHIIGKTVIVKSQYEMEHYSRLWREIIDMELDCFFRDGTWSLTRFSSLLKRLFAKEKYLAFCDACNGTYCIFLNGDIYPCYRAAEFPEFKLDAGSIKKADTLFMKGISKKVNETCSDCGILQLCGGGCAINSYEFGGEIANIYEPDCQMCRMYGELVLYMLGKIIKLPFDDIKKILRIGA